MLKWFWTIFSSGAPVYSTNWLRNEPLENLWGGWAKYKISYSRQGKLNVKKKKKRTVHKKNSCGSKIPLPKSPSFNIYLQSLMVNKTLNLVYLTLISTCPSCKTKKGHLRHLHAEAQSEIIQRRNHFWNNSARYFGYKLKVSQTFPNWA